MGALGPASRYGLVAVGGSSGREHLLGARTRAQSSPPRRKAPDSDRVGCREKDEREGGWLSSREQEPTAFGFGDRARKCQSDSMASGTCRNGGAAITARSLASRPSNVTGSGPDPSFRASLGRDRRRKDRLDAGIEIGVGRID